MLRGWLNAVNSDGRNTKCKLNKDYNAILILLAVTLARP
jgi:hypothetical protein